MTLAPFSANDYSRGVISDRDSRKFIEQATKGKSFISVTDLSNRFFKEVASESFDDRNFFDLLQRKPRNIGAGKTTSPEFFNLIDHEAAGVRLAAGAGAAAVDDDGGHRPGAPVGQVRGGKDPGQE